MAVRDVSAAYDLWLQRKAEVLRQSRKEEHQRRLLKRHEQQKVAEDRRRKEEAAAIAYNQWASEHKLKGGHLQKVEEYIVPAPAVVLTAEEQRARIQSYAATVPRPKQRAASSANAKAEEVTPRTAKARAEAKYDAWLAKKKDEDKARSAIKKVANQELSAEWKEIVVEARNARVRSALRRVDTPEAWPKAIRTPRPGEKPRGAQTHLDDYEISTKGGDYKVTLERHTAQPRPPTTKSTSSRRRGRGAAHAEPHQSEAAPATAVNDVPVPGETEEGFGLLAAFAYGKEPAFSKADAVNDEVEAELTARREEDEKDESSPSAEEEGFLIGCTTPRMGKQPDSGSATDATAGEENISMVPSPEVLRELVQQPEVTVELGEFVGSAPPEEEPEILLGCAAEQEEPEALEYEEDRPAGSERRASVAAEEVGDEASLQLTECAAGSEQPAPLDDDDEEEEEEEEEQSVDTSPRSQPTVVEASKLASGPSTGDGTDQTSSEDGFVERHDATGLSSSEEEDTSAGSDATVPPRLTKRESVGSIREPYVSSDPETD